MGPTGFQVKELVKPDTLVGGEWKGTKIGGCGPPWWPEDHHQVVVVVVLLLRQSSYLPCSLLQGAVGPSAKITKTKGMWKIKDEVLDNT